MKQAYSISIYLDKRRAKSKGKYPVKLRVYTPSPRKQKLYPTKFELSSKEFDSIWNTTKPRNEHKELRREIQSVENKALQVAEKLNPFTFEQFEKHLFRKAGEGIKVEYHYKQTVEALHKRGQIGTANSYDLSRKSIAEFIELKIKQNFSQVTFFDITPEWLKDYEYFMIEVKGRSITTVGIYLRALRAIFNKAIDEKEIEKDYYPFGKRKYQIPATKNVKKSLSKEQLKVLYQSTPKTPEQEKAKDFWFFSYACNGMNMKDILLLKFKDIEDSKIEFIRAKTKITSRTNLKPVIVYLNDFTNEIIEKYSIKNNDPEKYVFDILPENLTPQEQQTKIKNFTRFINQHMKKLCKENGLPDQISTYWARHSFATNAVRKGATLEFIQESLGHENLKTTQSYFAGFDSDTKKRICTILNGL